MCNEGRFAGGECLVHIMLDGLRVFEELCGIIGKCFGHFCFFSSCIRNSPRGFPGGAVFCPRPVLFLPTAIGLCDNVCFLDRGTGFSNRRQWGAYSRQHQKNTRGRALSPATYPTLMPIANF